MIVHFVDISGFIYHHCFEVIVRFIDISGIVDHRCLEVIVHFVKYWWNCSPSMFRGDISLC